MDMAVRLVGEQEATTTRDRAEQEHIKGRPGYVSVDVVDNRVGSTSKITRQAGCIKKTKVDSSRLALERIRSYKDSKTIVRA
jgi:hypothetical protein